MNDRNQKSNALIAFRDFFGSASRRRAARKPDLDHEEELVSQLSGKPFGEKMPGSHPGLHFGCPTSNDRRELTQNVLFWSPQGWPDQQMVSLASSRLGERLFENREFRDAVRSFLLRDPQYVIVIGQATTLDPIVTRGCQLFQRRSLRLIPFPKVINSRWIEHTLSTGNRSAWHVYFDASNMSIDQVAFLLSDQVRVLHIRAGGRMQEIMEGLPFDRGPTVYRLAHKSMDLPAERVGRSRSVTWYLYAGSEADPIATTQGCAPLIGIDQWHSPYLSHWTRKTRTPGPDQTAGTRFDRLLTGDVLSGPLDTLCRILGQDRLLGSGQLIRDRQRVVSLTEVPLEQFRQRRVFRKQHARWDFEPYGISFRQEIIECLGGKPVQYYSGNPVTLPTEPVFCQPKHSPSTGTDWSLEREWRVIGDIDLGKIGPADAAIFVPDRQSAEIVSSLSRWPVLVLP